MKTTTTPGELDERHPVVGLFRGGAITVTKGAEHIEYKSTRAGLPFLNGVERGYCRYSDLKPLQP